ncbi:glycerol-3-phosphate dehydrogenase/oxidase [Microbacterium aurantiacum]|uniref:Glycerol-3-phosphate dehydrogenase/oxidase n=1 Tax=Microbacterium aurantiacum TaxID=162393 RepID=A0ABT8FSV2_9MICO|nr:glycerol-3-phosphate dehydrogenase/oxidase [Microbacterium aurantiacum]MDN4464383.1 glycerol-3-phosphate dehydrogenase/oxidase [Microbacterium aurantiacum]
MSEVTPTTPESRTRDAVQAIAADPSADVIIVGGGINGIATFRDLALQGVKVILVERDDFVAGASSASSHMIHGGIRYLENGEFRLVRESVVERNALVKTAPHYVRPLPTTVPIFSTFSGILSAPLRFLTHKQGKHTERGALLIKVGLVIYDFFSRDGGAVPRHRFHGRTRTLSELPALNDRVKYTATYFDASMHDPERLALDVLYDGLDAGDNARAANYLEAVGMGEGGLRVRDRVSGEEFDLTAPVIVNASGPWTDLTNEQLGKPTTYMGGTKGSHIVLDNPELLEATGGREIFFEHEDGRIVLIYPLKGRVMVGTTDLDHDMREPAVCTEDEIDYFFDLVGHVFPDIRVDREQIVYRFSGVRPLPRHDDTQPGFVSRDYRIEEAPAAGRPGTTVLSLIGGKWTTFRALGEQLSDRVLEHLGRSRTRSTQGLMIGGALGYPRTQRARSAWVSDHADGRDHARVDQLLERYGTRAAALIESLDDSDAPLASLPDYSTGEIRYLVETEYVVHLIDVLLRRTSVAFVGKTSLPALRELADVAGDVLGWDAATRDEEVAETARILRERHGVELSEDSVLA